MAGITAYVGMPRSGKSYSVWENVIIPALKQGRNVVTNIPFNSEKVIADFGCIPLIFDNEEIKDNPNFFDEIQFGSVVVIDELWKIWPAGMKVTAMSESHKSFLAEHGHRVGEDGYSTEIILVTQDLSQVASFPRKLVVTTYRCVKHDDVGMSNHFRTDIYSGEVTGHSPPKSRLQRQILHQKYKEEVYQYYVSHTQSLTGKAGNEKRIDKRFNVLFNKKVMLMPLTFVALVFVVIYCYGIIASGFGAVEAEASTEVKQGHNNSQDTNQNKKKKKKVKNIIYIYPNIY